MRRPNRSTSGRWRSPRKALGPHPSRIVEALNNLAELYRTRVARGRRTALQAVAGDQRESARSRPSRCRGGAEQPGRALRRSGSLCRRRPLYKRRWRSGRKRSVPNHPDVATVAEQPGIALPAIRVASPTPSRSTNGRWRSARKRSVPTIPMSATSLNNLARFTMNQGRYADAEPLYKRSLAIARKCSVPTIPMSRHR